MRTNVSLENNTLCFPSSRYFCAKYLDCEWVEVFVHNMSSASRFSCVTSPFNYFHCTVTACGTPPFRSLAVILHLISILLLLTTKKLMPLLLTAANSVTFPGCVHSQFPPSLHSFSHGNMNLPSFTDTHIPNFNHKLYFSFPPCSQHDLTTLFPPPNRITASAGPAVPLLALLRAASMS